MPVDTGIYANMLRQPKSVQEYDQEAQAQQQNALQLAMGRAKMDEYQRSVQQDQQLRNLLSSGADANALRRGGFLKQANDWEANQAKIAQDRAQAGSATAAAGKTKVETIVKAMEFHNDELAGVNDPQSAARWAMAGFADPVIGPMLKERGATPEQYIASIPTTPAEFARWKKEKALGAREFIKQNKPQYMQQNLGGVSQITALPGLGGAPEIVSSSKVTQSPDSAASVAVQRENSIRADNRARELSVTHGVKGLTPEQNEALFGADGAVTTGRLDPGKINSRTASIFADAELSNPGTDFAKKSGDIALGRNATFRQKAMIAETLPEIMQNMVESGKKVGFSDVRTVGKMQAWVKGETNDPDMVEYMTQRNDALMTIAGVMRGVGMTDQAHRAETEVASPTMSPQALDAWMRGQMKSLQPRLNQNRKIVNGASGVQPSQPAAEPEAPVAIKSDADYHALKPGTRFVTPDGKTGTKK